MASDNIRLIFGLKLKQLRLRSQWSLQKLGQQVHLSPSYLNEIEKGKKYPRAEKIAEIARALDVDYDELISLRLDKELNPLEEFLTSDSLSRFPYHLFGIDQQGVLALMTEAPREASALVKALFDTARSYDLKLEDFFHTALRSYQALHNNYFQDIEDAVDGFRKKMAWPVSQGFTWNWFRDVLRESFHCETDETTLASHPTLSNVRSIWVPGHPDRLMVNPRFTELHKIFLAAREVGHRVLGLVERGHCSPDIEVMNFEQVLNAYKASYFASAWLMPRERVVSDLEAFFQNEQWDGHAFLRMLRSYDVTPENFFYRLAEILPRFFKIRQIHLLRIQWEQDRGGYQLTKQFNMSDMRLPTGAGLREHFCRRWLSITLIQEAVKNTAAGGPAWTTGVQRSRLLQNDQPYFNIALARPLVLRERAYSSIAIGFEIDKTVRKAVRFWNDAAIHDVVLGETCERCDMANCQERAVASWIQQDREGLQAQRSALQSILGT